MGSEKLIEISVFSIFFIGLKWEKLKNCIFLKTIQKSVSKSSTDLLKNLVVRENRLQKRRKFKNIRPFLVNFLLKSSKCSEIAS
jgi:hypothetical protein